MGYARLIRAVRHESLGAEAWHRGDAQSGRRQLEVPAVVNYKVMDVRVAPSLVVGYVMGSGDALADAYAHMDIFALPSARVRAVVRR